MNKKLFQNVNKLVVNYLSINGLTGNFFLDNNNPVVLYFMNVLMKNYIESNKDKKVNEINIPVEKIKVDYTEIEMDENTIKIVKEILPAIIDESYRLYLELDNIQKNIDKRIYIQLSLVFGGKKKMEIYIEEIFLQFKKSLYNVLYKYKVNSNRMILIKKAIFIDKMEDYIKIEKYEKAAFLKDKINILLEQEKEISEKEKIENILPK
jgi:hypothetical protein